jgi:uncharacterized protein
VNKIRNLLRINVGFLIGQPIGTSRDFSFEVPDLKLSDLEMSDFSGVAHISRTPQGLLLQGDFEAKVALDCVRCLTEYRQSLKTNFSELFAFKNRHTDESALILPEDGFIDLAPLLREYMLIEMPISPLCKEDCLGLCSVCGEDLNLNPHEHPVSEDEIVE